MYMKPVNCFKHGQPVFFKKIPATEKSPPNAVVNRYLEPYKGEPVLEIIYASSKWIVRECEVLDVGAALSVRAKELAALIDAQEVKHPRKPDLIKALGICESTFKRWNRIIQNHLPHDP